MITRGVRNNNPFNVCKGASRWLGLVPAYKSTDSRFCQFIDMKYGIRCGIVLLRRYIQNYKLDSVRGIISRFAPANENDTETYISFIEKYLEDRGFLPTNIKYRSEAFLVLCQGIMYFESRYVAERSYIRSIIDYFGL